MGCIVELVIVGRKSVLCFLIYTGKQRKRRQTSDLRQLTGFFVNQWFCMCSLEYQCSFQDFLFKMYFFFYWKQGWMMDRKHDENVQKVKHLKRTSKGHLHIWQSSCGKGWADHRKNGSQIALLAIKWRSAHDIKDHQWKNFICLGPYSGVCRYIVQGHNNKPKL